MNFFVGSCDVTVGRNNKQTGRDECNVFRRCFAAIHHARGAHITIINMKVLQFKGRQLGGDDGVSPLLGACNNREWLSHYVIVCSLILNPD